VNGAACGACGVGSREEEAWGGAIGSAGTETVVKMMAYGGMVVRTGTRLRMRTVSTPGRRRTRIMLKCILEGR